jgi:Undecaprenyl-phosphate glucose phosphotransferase
VNRRNQDALMVIRASSDVVMVTIGWIIAYELRFSGLFPITKGIPAPLLYYKLAPFVAGIWFLSFVASGFYRRTGRHRSAFVEALDTLQSCVVATFAFIAFTYLYEEYRYSRVVMGLFLAIHPWLIIAGRSAVRKALRLYRLRAAPRRTLIIGGGDTLKHAIEMAKDGDLTRSEIYGVILAGGPEQIAASEALCRQSGLHRLDAPSNWPDFFSANPTESVVFALPHQAYDFVDRHLERIADQVTDVRLIPDLFRFTRFAAGVDIVAGTPVVSINESPLAGIGSIIKRVVDILGSCCALLLFGPLMLVIAALVAVTSRGPVFYRQERMGLDGKTFAILKFRSMRSDAEAKSGAVWAKEGDDRTTPIGKWLRRTSLDELPQLFNVLGGSMSLVGPRPERPIFVEQFRRDVPGYYLRHKIKAGITGWAQANGWRGNTSIEKRIEYDLYYIQNWSLWLDVRIILLTILRGFINRNAY